MEKINLVGVVGAGTMGSALAQKFAQEGFRVILVDREMRFVEKGMAAVDKTLSEGVERKLFTEDQVSQILARIKGTDQLKELKPCDLVVEAIFEDFQAKLELFGELSKILSATAVVATNTSSFSVTELARSMSHPERFIGMHYFYHAAKNRLVEIIPGEQTSTATLKTCEIFSFLTGKDPIICKDSYGFVVNRFFVPWLNEAVRLFQEGVGDTARIDQVCMTTFKIGMGPFALMNATGVPIAYHAQKTLEVFGDFYQVAESLKRQALAGEPWKIEVVSGNGVDPQAEKLIRERMLGTVFFVCSQILDEEICSAVELNRSARIGLRWRKGPVELMKSHGEEEVRRLIQKMVDRYGMRMPSSIGPRFWKMEFVELRKCDSIAVITISRPEDLNALNEEVVAQLSEKFAEANDDARVETIYLTGSGKAFVAGADVRFFVDNMRRGRIEKIVAFTQFGQSVFQRIDESPKKVVAILNGLSLGGGLELALCADVILATPAVKMGFPETGLGIYPGLGGTYRTQRRIGKGLTKYLIYTGSLINATDARKIGLVDAMIQPEEIFALKEGKMPVPTPGESREIADPVWKAIQDFFEKNSLRNITNQEYNESLLDREGAERFGKIIARKAPIALKMAEKLIDMDDEARCAAAELAGIEKIFSTKDALLGLSSIGKRVEFKGE